MDLWITSDIAKCLLPIIKDHPSSEVRNMSTTCENIIKGDEEASIILRNNMPIIINNSDVDIRQRIHNIYLDDICSNLQKMTEGNCVLRYST